MKGIPWWFWVVIGVGGLLAYSYGHRFGFSRAVSAEAIRQSTEASVPLQEYTQPQPVSFGASPYGDSAHGTATSTPTFPGNAQVQYTSSYGAFVG